MSAHKKNPCVNKPKMKVGTGVYRIIPNFFFGEVGAHSLRDREREWQKMMLKIKHGPSQGES